MKSVKRHYLSDKIKRVLSLTLTDQTEEKRTPSHADFVRWVWVALSGKYQRANIGMLLATEEEARAYNHDYRGKNYATNVLSFPLDEPQTAFRQPDACKVLSGDLILCPAVVEKEAKEQGKDLMAHYAHLTVHGMLHLQGFDHIREDEAEIMERLEIKHLFQLGYSNPYCEET